ncbi:helix-turn-helix transcriptional regulator [Streptomyces lavendulae]|uniref:helix-turn-helix domain-containing protein n=1 Tax=Streptomyces lavendulae TaxID=1914 RepID=UPI0033240428
MAEEMAFSGQRLRIMRESRGLSQRVLAAKMGVKPNYLSKWEAGSSPNGVNMVKLLRALECELEEVTE